MFLSLAEFADDPLAAIKADFDRVFRSLPSGLTIESRYFSPGNEHRFVLIFAASRIRFDGENSTIERNAS